MRPKLKTDPEMVALATQLIQRKSGRYDPSDIEDRYETRLRAILDAKIKGEGYGEEVEVQPDRSNVIDLRAALKKSLGEVQPVAAAAEPPQTKKARAAEAARSFGSQSEAAPIWWTVDGLDS